MKITATPEGAAACREFAAAMPMAVENIKASTKKLSNVYKSVSDRVGIHEDQFSEMLTTVKKMQEEASDSILQLPKMLNETADKIDVFVAQNRGISGK